MRRSIVVTGTLTGPRRLELDEPVEQLSGKVEVVLRPAPGASNGGRHADAFELLAGWPPGERSKEEIDRQVAEVRTAWE